MKIRFGIAAVLLLLSAVCVPCAAVRAGEAQTGDAPALTILCTTFPIHQITRNVVGDAKGVTVDLLLPAGSGCPHDYALTPQELTRLSKADILVVNGLGMESFLDDALTNANPDITVIDSAEDMDDLLGYETVQGLADEHGHVHDEHGEHDHEDGDESEHDHAGHAHEDGINPHLFASPARSAELAINIAGKLADLDEDRAETYNRNAAAYAASMRRLAEEMKTAAAAFANNRIVEPHGAFDYLANDIGLDIVAMMQPHGQELSAAQMLSLLEEIRENDAGAIVTEPQYPARTGEMLSRETGLPVVMLDPGAAGPDNAPLNHYETVMRKNLETLVKTLGRK